MKLNTKALSHLVNHVRIEIYFKMTVVVKDTILRKQVEN